MLAGSILTVSLVTFIGKMFACGLLGFGLLALIRIIVDVKMNPKGWKFGNELYDHHEDSFFNQQPERKVRLNYQRVRVNRENHFKK